MARLLNNLYIYNIAPFYFKFPLDNLYTFLHPVIVPVPKSRPKSSLECIRGNNDSPNLPTRIIHTPPIHSNDSAQFDYEDINYDYDEVPDDTIENDEHYDDPTDLNEPPCDYEVPSQTKPVLAPTISVPITNLIPTAKPVPTNKPVPAKRSNGRNVTSAPVLSSPCDDKPPPVPPPRNRSSRTKGTIKIIISYSCSRFYTELFVRERKE